MAYKYAEILAAMAERAKVSDTPWDVVQLLIYKDWISIGFMPSFNDDSVEYRIKPRTIKIGNREVSEPLKASDVKQGDRYWFPSLLRSVIIDYDVVRPYQNLNELSVFNRGLARRTKEEAIELAEALLEVLNGS